MSISLDNVYGFDIEALPLQLYHPNARLLCASISQNYSITYVRDHIHVEKIDKGFNLTNLAFIGSILKDPSNILVGHNISFDISGWERFYREQRNNNNKSIRTNLFDTMIAHYLIDPDFKNSLDNVARKYLGFSKIELSHKEIPNAPLDKLTFYNAVDSILVYRLYPILYGEIKERNLEILFNWLMKILKVIISMQIKGVRLDLDYLVKHREEVEDKILEKEQELTGSFGDINFNSWQQLAVVMYDQWDLPILKTSGKGNPSTDAETIVKLKNDNNIPEDKKKALISLSDYRQLNKIHSTYLVPLEFNHLGFDNRIHTSYFLGRSYEGGKFYGTISGRTSSSNPNLQNQPNTTDIAGLTVNVRKAFIPSEGLKFYKADYSQLEMRVAAFLSNDDNMQNVFRNGIDIHTYSLSGVFEEDYDYLVEQLEKEDKEWKERRRLIKNFNFALIYGASPFKLQMMLLSDLEIDMDLNDVRLICKKWNRLYPRFTKWRYLVHQTIDALGFVETETGRRRYFFDPEDIDKLSNKDKAQYYREGLNDLIQSLANDIALLGLYYLNQIDNIQPLLFVHDSMDGEYTGELDRDKVKESMIVKPKKTLTEDFDLDVSNLYLDVDIQDNLESWG